MKVSGKYARSERGNCGVCGYDYVVRRDGRLPVHTRLWCGGDRTTCEGSNTVGVSRKAALRALVGFPPAVAAVDRGPDASTDRPRALDSSYPSDSSPVVAAEGRAVPAADNHHNALTYRYVLVPPAVPAPPPLDESRCAICGWPLKADYRAGCVRGNCSQRPFPGRYYDAERARREYGVPLPAEEPLSAAEVEIRLLKQQVAELRTARAPVENPPLLVLAERIARMAHAGQKEESTGDDYILHVQRVVALVGSEHEKAVAWLHDVLEDAPLTALGLEIAGVPREIIEVVSILTRADPYEYQPYIRSIIESGNPLAIAVKHADLVDHLRPNCPESLRPRYERALQHISQAVAVPSPPEPEQP